MKQETRGRKVNPLSARQARLARYAEKKANGIEVKRGRPTGSKQKSPTKAKKVTAK